MRRLLTITSFIVLLVASTPALAQDHLGSPYRHQLQSGLRGLNASEIAELRAGTGMGLARAAELNDYPGPRHVLDAIESGRLQATTEQSERIRGIFDAMKRDAQRVGAQILEAEQQLETAFRSRAMQDADLRTRVARIAALQSDLRVIHLGAHLATRAILSNAQVARYNEIRGYTSGLPAEHRGDSHRD